MSKIVMTSSPRIICGGWVCTRDETVVNHLGTGNTIELNGLTNEDIGDLAKVLQRVYEWSQNED